MKVDIAQFGQLRGQVRPLFQDLLVNTFAPGVDHTVEINHGADLEVIEISVLYRKRQPDCFSLLFLIGHSIV